MLQQFRGDQMWDLKHFRGGQVDLDFIAQTLQLRHAHAHPAILAREAGAVFAKARDLGLMGGEDAETLIAIARFWRQLQQMIRLLVGGKVDEATLSEATRRHLASSAGVDSFDALKAIILQRAGVAHALFKKLIGPDK
jgi:glutamate-ammonia-ligase adenylyltransferase